MSTERIKVAIRIRPFLPNEISSNKAINLIPEDENTLILYKDSQKFQGTFNQIFSDDSTQKEVFNFIKPCIYNIKAGINCTILAYGQTGTGKTYTMFGGDWSYNEDNYDSNNCLLKIENNYIIYLIKIVMKKKIMKIIMKKKIMKIIMIKKIMKIIMIL